MIFRTCAPLINSIPGYNNIQIYNVKDTDVVIIIQKKTGILSKYYWDEPNATIADYESFRLKAK